MIYPPWAPVIDVGAFPPLSIASLCGVLRKEGYEVKGFDFNIVAFNRVPKKYKSFWKSDHSRYWSDKKLFYEITFPLLLKEFCQEWVRQILESKAQIIGFSVYFTSKWTALLLAKEIKKCGRDHTIIFGGPECSLKTAKEFLNENVDKIVIGEGEYTLIELVNTLSKGNDIEIPGVCMRRKNGIIYGGAREPIKHLDELPFPNFESLDLDEYKKSSNQIFLPVMWSRGCLGKCAYCGHRIVWKCYREKSPEKVVSELIYLVQTYKISNFHIYDSSITWNPNRLEKICDYIINCGLEIKWDAFGRPDKEVTKELLGKLYKAGCRELRYGVESGSQKILEKMGRGTNVAVMQNVIRNTWNSGIKVVVHVVAGFPGESLKDFWKTVLFLLKNRKYLTRISPHYCEIYPGTALQKDPLRYGIIFPKGIFTNPNAWKTKYPLNTYFIRVIRYIILFLLSYYAKERTTAPNIFICILNRIKFSFQSKIKIYKTTLFKVR